MQKAWIVALYQKDARRALAPPSLKPWLFSAGLSYTESGAAPSLVCCFQSRGRSGSASFCCQLSPRKRHVAARRRVQWVQMQIEKHGWDRLKALAMSQGCVVLWLGPLLVRRGKREGDSYVHHCSPTEATCAFLGAVFGTLVVIS